ncbi:MAG: DUF3421 domain-containing protein [Acidobacteria bacterium]|nr:MAG: DUF3421 domain-containing protein [Acidobacteriota bacterium]REK02247.1 MAG: DUF3421 domain-containing protein [Acidobacteriota bacterium]REK13950.1 MAG: DUF3421 domain-containing protein [Acidobacteriota bacterium]REK41944.1 MAG: DUF3421 domain-containing protein [Acidobacteriota bacterium]
MAIRLVSIRATQLGIFVLFIAISGAFGQYEESWRRVSNGNVPAGTVSGGALLDGTPIYVCRARYRGRWVGGRLLSNRCYIADGRRGRSETNFEVLVDGAGEFRWNRFRTLDYAIPVEDDRYVCRVPASDEGFVGELSNGRCRYAVGESGESSSVFEILEGREMSADVIRASENGDLNALRAAIRAGQLIDKRNSVGRTALMIAAEKGSDAIVEELIANRAAVNAVDDEGNSALILASREGKESTVGKLLGEGADPLIANRSGQTALTASAANGQEDVVRVLINDVSFTGMDVPNSINAFLEAARNGKEDVIEVFLESGMDVNVEDSGSGRTALMEAAAGKHGDTIKVLFSKNPDLEMIDEQGFSALQLASIADSDKTLKVFFEETGRVKQSDPEAQRALRAAARFGKRDSLEYLIKRGVDVNSKDNYNGFSALMWSASEGHEGATELLIRARADLNAVNDQGETALMLAAAHSKSNTLKELISAGADLNLRDKQGRTALAWAILHDHDDTRKELEKAGAQR